ncbi:MAG TPA: hypothetical protein PLO93_02375, partial [Candidatus Omnitrophota bacterium]|nr:hypothetical protein [Candidatus Omnitrophota bacterium]
SDADQRVSEAASLKKQELRNAEAQAEKEAAEAARLADEKAAQEKADQEKAAQAEAARLAEEKAEADRIAGEKAGQEDTETTLNAQQAEADDRIAENKLKANKAIDSLQKLIDQYNNLIEKFRAGNDLATAQKYEQLRDQVQGKIEKIRNENNGTLSSALKANNSSSSSSVRSWKNIFNRNKISAQDPAEQSTDRSAEDSIQVPEFNENGPVKVTPEAEELEDLIRSLVDQYKNYLAIVEDVKARLPQLEALRVLLTETTKQVEETQELAMGNEDPETISAISEAVLEMISTTETLRADLTNFENEIVTLKEQAGQRLNAMGDLYEDIAQKQRFYQEKKEQASRAQQKAQDALRKAHDEYNTANNSQQTAISLVGEKEAAATKAQEAINVLLQSIQTAKEWLDPLKEELRSLEQRIRDEKALEAGRRSQRETFENRADHLKIKRMYCKQN